jgi:Beta-1,3-glucanase
MQAYIDQVWAKFTAQQWSEVHDGRTFTGRISGGVLTGTRDDGSPFHVAKPTSTQVFECSGPLALGDDRGGSDTTREVGRDFCAAFNRGVAVNPADWYNPARYYRTGPRNDYARYFHSVNLGNRSYAFAYDDVNDQSSVQILGNANPPTSLTLAIGW